MMAKKKKEIQVRKIVRFIDFGIFPGCVCFCNGYSTEELIRIFKTKKYKAENQYLYILEHKDFSSIKNKFFATHDEVIQGEITEHVYFIIFKEPFLFLDRSYVLLAHEVLHICQFYLKRVLDRDKEIEAEAYLHSYIMEKILIELRGKEK